MAWDVCAARRRCLVFMLGCALPLAAALLTPSADAEDSSPELIQPPICSKHQNTAGKTPRGAEVCTVTSLGVDAEGVEHHEIKIDLTAQSSPIEVGGYSVTTEHYNDAYLTPVVEALAGDAVAAHLLNMLPPLSTSDCDPAHGDTCENATNLHYFHGGIVSPQNARSDDIDASKGHGDNIYVYRKRGEDFDNRVPIPDDLNAEVLEQSGIIKHPPGLNWYHSHLHGISAEQVGGGMSGLLSIGDQMENLHGKTQDDTKVLRARTDSSYLMLRDLPIVSTTPPEAANGKTPAEWRRELPTKTYPRANPCALSATDVPMPAEPRREGYCWANSDSTSIWLFTVNGQRFPTIYVDADRNRLLRVANLSSNFTYELMLVPKSGGDPYKFDLLTVDGVVPGNPVPTTTRDIPVEATSLTKLVLMPASRAEVYVRNDGRDAAPEREFILRTEEIHTSMAGPGDDWPQIQLARIVFRQRVPAAPQIPVALNTIRSVEFPTPFAAPSARVEEKLPDGCIRDIDQHAKEHRQVLFTIRGSGFGISTKIMRPIPGNTGGDPAEDFEEAGEDTTIPPLSFHEYLDDDHKVDWDSSATGNQHVCVRLTTGAKQLWELFNGTTEWHNFHIHQMKFRLAKEEDLERYGINPKFVKRPDADRYSLLGLIASEGSGSSRDVWHDTIPVGPSSRVFLIMSFVAKQQLGRFVFHCHILKHEDMGLMAPIEVIE